MLMIGVKTLAQRASFRHHLMTTGTVLNPLSLYRAVTERATMVKARLIKASVLVGQAVDLFLEGRGPKQRVYPGLNVDPNRVTLDPRSMLEMIQGRQLEQY